jgi:hypothetical protein
MKPEEPVAAPSSARGLGGEATDWQALRLVAREERRRRPPVEDGGKLPGEVVNLGDPRVGATIVASSMLCAAPESSHGRGPPRFV